MLKSYIIVTPSRNEEKNLPALIESVANQTLKPSLHVIVDDNSEDNTPNILKSYMKSYNWIKCVFIDKKSGYMGIHYSEVCRIGFDFVVDYCKKDKIEYKYIGLLDADIVLGKDYFECIIDEFERDDSLGIASGDTWSVSGDKLIKEGQRKDLPSGAARVWRKSCFVQTGGYLRTHAPDSVSNVKAKLLGWKTKRFDNYRVIQARKAGTGQSLWKSHKSQGEAAYYLNKHPFLVLLNMIYFTTKKPYYTGIAFLGVYLISAFKKGKKIDDDEIKDYYWNTRLKEYKEMLVERIKSVGMR